MRPLFFRLTPGNSAGWRAASRRCDSCPISPEHPVAPVIHPIQRARHEIRQRIPHRQTKAVKLIGEPRHGTSKHRVIVNGLLRQARSSAHIAVLSPHSTQPRGHVGSYSPDACASGWRETPRRSTPYTTAILDVARRDVKVALRPESVPDHSVRPRRGADTNPRDWTSSESCRWAYRRRAPHARSRGAC